MKINPYLFFDGRCVEAFDLYEKHLGGKIEFKMTHGESPMAAETPKERQGKILHARMKVGGADLMGSDAPPERYDKPKGFFISLNVDTPAEAERVFKILSEGGKVHMPLEETFWARRFAMVVDRFDIPWMINCEKTP
jgi:PhnB protein